MKSTLVIIAILTCLTVYSQDYKRAIGVRGGIYNSFCYKQSYTDEKMFEGLVTVNPNAIRIVGLKEFHKPMTLEFTDKLFFYYGYGAHVGLTNDRMIEIPITYYDRPFRNQRVYPVVGLDAVFGIEYRLIRFPFTAGIDYIPYFDLFGPNYFNSHFADIALSVKYTF